MKVVSDTVKSFYKELGVKTVTTLNCPQENASDITTTTNPEKDPFEEVLENSDFANDNLEQKSNEDEIEFITSDTLENDEKVSYSDILIEVLDNNRNAATKNLDLQDQVVQNGDVESENFEEKSRDGSPKVLENGLVNGSVLELQNVKPVQNGTVASTFSSDDTSEDKTNSGDQNQTILIFIILKFLMTVWKKEKFTLPDQKIFRQINLEKKGCFHGIFATC